MKPVVTSWLSSAQKELLDKHAPERLSLPNDRTPKVVYEKGKSPSSRCGFRSFTT